MEFNHLLTLFEDTTVFESTLLLAGDIKPEKAP